MKDIIFSDVVCNAAAWVLDIDLQVSAAGCLMRSLVLLQGLALRLHHEDIGTERFSRTIKRVLTEHSFKEVAKQLSVKLRARPRTPMQEAAGESSTSHGSCHARCDYNETPCSEWPPAFG